MRVLDNTTVLYRILVTFFIVLLVAVLIQQYVAHRESRAVQAIEVGIKLVEADMRLLYANNTDSITPNAYDPLRGTCSADNQDQFDRQLNRLGSGLSAHELQFLAAHFDRCASDFAYQQLVHTAQLQQYVAELERWETRRSVLYESDESDSVTGIADWKQLMELEQQINELQFELIEGQRSLIEARQDRQPTDGAAIAAILEHVQEAREELGKRQAEQQELHGQLKL